MKNKENIRIINVRGRDLSLKIRRNSQARRMILRVDSDIGGAAVTLPLRSSEREALLMVQEKSDWLFTRLDSIPPKVPFENGAQIPILGEYHTIYHDPYQREVVVRINNKIHMGGRKEHLARRLRDWLRIEAKNIIQPKAIEMANELNKKIGRISIRDTKSRWGSCSTSGNLSFCWRLILTPGWVLNYVIAHEVSHLVYMNHGSEFWKTVEDLNVQIEDARQWLNENREHIQRYG